MMGIKRFDHRTNVIANENSKDSQDVSQLCTNK